MRVALGCTPATEPEVAAFVAYAMAVDPPVAHDLVVPALDADTTRDRLRKLLGEQSARVTVECSSALSRGAWRTRVQTHSEMTATGVEFLVEQRLDAYEGDEQVYSRTWELSFPRDGV